MHSFDFHKYTYTRGTLCVLYKKHRETITTRVKLTQIIGETVQNIYLHSITKLYSINTRSKR